MVYLSIAALFVSIVGLLVQHFAFIAKLQERISKLETKVELFWKSVEESVVRMLRHPTTPELDALMDKLVDRTISLPELVKLQSILVLDLDKSKDGTGCQKALAEGLLLGIVNARIVEIGHGYLRRRYPEKD